VIDVADVKSRDTIVEAIRAAMEEFLDEAALP
jgi:hypothetical protein